jgi:hypothetical protein
MWVLIVDNIVVSVMSFFFLEIMPAPNRASLDKALQLPLCDCVDLGLGR